MKDINKCYKSKKGFHKSYFYALLGIVSPYLSLGYKREPRHIKKMLFGIERWEDL